MKFRHRTVASITASLARIVDELKAHAENNLAAAQKSNEQAARILAERQVAVEEAEKAKVAAEKIAALLS